MKKGKKEFILLALFIALLGALVFSGGTKSALAKSGLKIPKEIRIGDVVSYTGPYAGFGHNSLGGSGL